MLNAIHQSTDESTFEKISGAQISKEAWEILQESLQGAKRARRLHLQTLRAEFENFKMKISESISEYVTRVKSMANKMKRNKETLDDVQVTEKILRSLTHKFNYVVAAIVESNDLSKMSFDELMGSLQAQEHKMKQYDDYEYLDQALQSTLSFTERSTRNSSEKVQTTVEDIMEDKKVATEVVMDNVDETINHMAEDSQTRLS